jgi:hypothetical protein
MHKCVCFVISNAKYFKIGKIIFLKDLRISNSILERYLNISRNVVGGLLQY